jgi:hypothetical protein
MAFWGRRTLGACGALRAHDLGTTKDLKLQRKVGAHPSTLGHDIEQLLLHRARTEFGRVAARKK